MTDCSGLIGLTEPQLADRLGQPATRRETGDDVWCVFAPGDLTCRVRLRTDADGTRCASWTASFALGYPTLASALSEVGLWPAAGPDERADLATTPLVRRPLPEPERSGVHSLTATIRNGLVTQVSVFDEAPDWD